jgi:hypothetical protein
MDQQNNMQGKARGEGILPSFSSIGKGWRERWYGLAAHEARPQRAPSLPRGWPCHAISTGRKAGTALPRGFATKGVLLINALAVIVAAACFVVIAVWLPLKAPFFDAPLRSFLTGLGLLGLSCPPFTIGFIFQKKAAVSPYYEEGFIRTGFYIVGFVCLIVGLICIGLSAYALIMRMFLEEEKPSLILSTSLAAPNFKHLCLNSAGYLGTILKATSFPI